MIVFVAACASAQSFDSGLAFQATDIDVPRLLTDHGIKSATEFAETYQTFRTAVAAIPVARTKMEQAVSCAVKRQPNAACITGFDAAIREFQMARFDLRRSYNRANDALNGVALEIVAQSLSTNGSKRLELSAEESAAVRRYCRETRTSIAANFAAAERQWHRTWRRVERTIYHHRHRW
jgi:hypothetical protein